MGLLDKVDNLDETQPAKAKPKAAKAVAKAKPKAAKAVAKAAPKSKSPARPAKAAKAAKAKDKPEKIRPSASQKDTSWQARCLGTLVG